ncbi:Oxidoreductase BOA1 [Fusarium oxysporum f. sp. albedinis]|nr:Oxidoreductase BOA1 [Fusarium oxysporum f. sp. albedinis]
MCWSISSSFRKLWSNMRSKRKPVKIASLQYFLPFYIDGHLSRHSSSGKSETKTKVAILDTGIGSIFFPGSERKVTGRSFVTNSLPERELESPWWISSDPHGSQMANIIAQLDPTCELVICKVAEKRNSFHINSVTNAIKWALQQQVDIINCSFVLYGNNNELFQAMEDADAKGTAIICSTADRGHIQQVVWPAWYNKNKQLSNIFPTAPCNDFGRITEYGTEKTSDYLLPGVDIDASGPGASLSDPVSGSSVATAMASGIASVIVGCCRLSTQLAANQRPKHCIRTVFESMCALDVVNDSGPRRLVPTRVFPERPPPLTGEKAESDYDLRSKSLATWLKVFFVGKRK